jgi:hypothetical protein
MDRRLGGLQKRSGRYGEEKKLAMPGIEPGLSTKTLIYRNGFKIRIRRNCEHGYSLRTLVSSCPLSRMLKVNYFL